MKEVKLVERKPSDEIFLNINGYEDYLISNSGKVKSIKNGSEKLLKNRVQTHGYNIVALYKNDKPKNLRVHRLVAEAFIPNPENKPQVNHIDGNKNNNHVENLEWCTNGENGKHAYRIGLKKRKLGSKHHGSKLKEQDVIEIKAMLKEGVLTQLEISRKYNVSRSTIGYIKSGKNWKEVN